MRGYIIGIVLLTACGSGSQKEYSPPGADAVFYNIDWQEGFGLTHDTMIDSVWQKPVKFYLDQPSCSPLARDFYFGIFRPSDNDSTTELLDLATTEDGQLRPFYRWCLNKTIQIQDGALAEYTGVPARRYAEKFPIEFFVYMDQDTSGSRYLDWTSAISYSGFYDQDNYKQADKIRKAFADKMKQQCRNCSPDWVARIEKFVRDCFH
jgi:hypothetical protein